MRYVGNLLCLALITCTVAGCGNPFGPGRSGQQNGEPEIVFPVEAEPPQRGAISAYFETHSRVEAEFAVDIFPQAVEKCTDVFVEEGDTVRKGEPLAQLDQKNLDKQLLELRTQVARQKADMERYKMMDEGGIGRRVDYENAKASYEQGLAQLERMELEYAELTIRSPLSGIVTMKNIQEGQLVSSGTPVFRVVNPDSYILVINVPEKEMAQLREGQKAMVSLDAVGDEEFEAKVRKINPFVDPSSGTVKVILDFQKATLDRLRDAAFARVRLIMETHENALLVPKDAIVEETARKYLFVVEPEGMEAESDDEETESSGTLVEAASDAEGPGSSDEPESKDEDDDGESVLIARRVEVETGLEDSNNIEILSGVDEDSLIITLGQQNLKPGAKVKVTNAEAELFAKAEMTPEEALAAAKAERERGATDVQRRRRF